MSIAHDVKKLIEARAARIAHAAKIMARPIDLTTRHARLASILASSDPTTPRRTRIRELLLTAQTRREFADVA